MAKDVIPLNKQRFESLPKRGITEATCAKWKYGKAVYKGRAVQVANYFDGAGHLVGQKLRFPDKSFAVLGTVGKASELYGQHLWRQGGKKLVITEGEIDALTVSQLQENRWPVVSVPNGCQGARAALQANLEWVESFDIVVLMFDSDEPGTEAAHQCAQLLSPGKARIAHLPGKDANALHLAGESEAVIRAMWDAKPYRPDGIVDAADLWDVVSAPLPYSPIDYPWPTLNDMLMGMRPGELVTLTSGSGMGKSAISRELAYWLLTEKQETVGYIALEESTRRTMYGLIGLHMNEPVHLAPEGYAGLPEASQQRFSEAFQALTADHRLHLYDHWGSTESDNLLAKIRYLAKGLGCKWIFLDHLSIVVSGLDLDDERKAIDATMTRLRSMVEETGVGMFLVSHLKRPPGDRGHEDGAIVRMAQLRGSGAIGQLSDAVIGLERNQQAKGDMRDVSLLRILKSRFNGRTGPAGYLRYDHDTGRLTECDPDFVDGDTEEEFDDDF